MSKKIATSEAVFAACEALAATGKPWNRDDVRHKIGGGSFNAIDPLIKAWRMLQALREDAPHTPSLFLKQIVDSVEAHFVQLHTQYETTHQAQAKVFHQTATELSEHINDVSQQLSDQQVSLERVQENLKNLGKQLTEKTQLIDKLKEENAKTQHENDTLSGLCTRLESESKQQRERHEKILKDERQKYEVAMSELINRHELELKKQKKELVDAGEASENRLMRLLDQGRDEHRRQTKILEAKIERVQQSEKQLQSTLNQKTESFAKAESSLDEAIRNNTSLSKQIKTMTQENQQLREKSTKLESKLSSNDQIDEIKVILERLQTSTAVL